MTQRTKYHLCAMALALGIGVGGPALADDHVTAPENPDLSEGAELLNRGFQKLLEGLAKELEPMSDDWAEGWADLMTRFGDMSLYHAPETLPNGDIIIRRRDPLPMVPEADGSAEGETEI